jgi:5-methylcytosine-specific restriction endonuclease McrA
MTTTRDDLDTERSVLAFARESRVAADRAEADLLVAAVTWAEQHPPESIIHAAVWPVAGMESEVTLAGEGAPLVAEFCIAEFATAIGRSTDAGRAKIAHALELKYRLPRHWQRIQTGTLEPWRGCRIAAATLGLSQDAAAYIDAQLVSVAHRVGLTVLDRLVEQAVARFMPEKAEVDAQKAAEERHVTFFHHQLSCDGTTMVQAELDLADALDLDAAITAEAEALRLAGCTEPLDVRRALAAGRLARRQLGLPFDETPSDTARPASKKVRQVVLYVHLSEAAITGHGRGELAQVENHHRTVLADQVRDWCVDPEANVVVKPVIDLDQHISVTAYEIPERLTEQAIVRDGTCVFPWCGRPARSCDIDHVIPHQRGGPTASDNTAPLCRRHHRLKTHSPWTYTVIDPGTYLWSSPHGYQYLRDHTGTQDISPPDD